MSQARNSEDVKAVKGRGVEACLRKKEGKPRSPTGPSASCCATGENVGIATGEKDGPARETVGGGGGSDEGLITRALLAFVELEALDC